MKRNYKIFEFQRAMIGIRSIRKSSTIARYVGIAKGIFNNAMEYLAGTWSKHTMRLIRRVLELIKFVFTVRTRKQANGTSYYIPSLELVIYLEFEEVYIFSSLSDFEYFQKYRMRLELKIFRMLNLIKQAI